MLTTVDAEALIRAGWVHRGAAEALAEGIGALDVAGTAGAILRARMPQVSVAAAEVDGLLPPWQVDGDASFVRRQRAAAHAEEDLARLLALIHVEQWRLGALAVTLTALTRLWAEVDACVTAALRSLDHGAHDHPTVIQWVARVAQPGLPLILDTAELIGWLSEDRQDFLGVQRLGAAECPLPRTTGDLLAGDVEVEQHPGRVRVLEVLRADGTSGWVVQISGTQQWGPRSGPEVFDMTSDLRAVNGDSTLAAVGVHLALLQAQRSTGRDTSRDPVIVTGHSLGGILAASLAADPTFRHGRTVVAVVTAGSPISTMPIPESVDVLALEHTRDAVPRLDGRADPSRPGWTTIEVEASPGATGGLASRTHAGALYAASARAEDARAAGDPAVEPWEEVVAPVLSGGVRAIAHDFTLTREWQNPRT